MKIVADDKIPYLRGALETRAEVHYLPGGEIGNKHLRDADALITRTRTRCNRELLEGTSVKFIATATIGHDHIDADYCRDAGIEWANAPGCNSGSVQQYLASVLVWLSRKHGFSLSDKTLGIVGVGNVGKKVAEMALMLGMKVLLNDPPRQRAEQDECFVSLEKIKKEADIITFHVPLTKEGQDKTWHLCDGAFLSEISHECFIINSSRGSVVDNDVLKQALAKKDIKGAVLDVWENEPGIDTGLLDLVDIGTPHIAGYSRDGKANGTAMSVMAIDRFFKLGIGDWYPCAIEKPGNSVVTINCTGKSDEQIIANALYACYDIAEDDTRLRQSVQSFEALRGDYPVRREYMAYLLKLLNGRDYLKEKMRRFGFEIV